MTEPRHKNLTPGSSYAQDPLPLNRERKPEQHFRLLTLREAEQLFGLSEFYVYRGVRKGDIHPVKPNGRTLYPEWELEAVAAALRDNYAA
jgi:hypothetical protein